MLELRCPTHTGYRGINLPTTECQDCNAIRALRMSYWYLVKNLPGASKRKARIRRKERSREEIMQAMGAAMQHQASLAVELVKNGN